MTTTPCSDGGDQHNEEQVFRGTRFEVWSCFDCGKERIIDYADPANGDISEEIWVSVSVLSVKVVGSIGRSIGRDVVWAWAIPHQYGGRYVFVTTLDHHHGWYDRIVGAYEEIEVADFCNDTCRTLFEGDPAQSVISTRSSELRRR